MNEVFAWAGFAGAWLLVAGPLYQGSLELRELDLDREGIEGVKASAVQAVRQGQPSAWWWLLPPVMYVLHRRRWNEAFRQATAAQLSDAQREQLTSFRNRATGWFTVATGAALLAAKETWQICAHYGWPAWLLWLLIVGMVAASVLNTAVRRISDDQGGTELAPAAEQP
jgi:hypothetical protein